METHRFLNNHQIKELPHLPKRSEEDHKRMIRKMGLKVTEQRITILSYLYKMPKHITAQELYECIHPVDSSIGFATIYRFLKRLVENKIISETRVNNMPARYELIEGDITIIWFVYTVDASVSFTTPKSKNYKKILLKNLDLSSQIILWNYRAIASNAAQNAHQNPQSRKFCSQ